MEQIIIGLAGVVEQVEDNQVLALVELVELVVLAVVVCIPKAMAVLEAVVL
jgi:hypothetical protein